MAVQMQNSDIFLARSLSNDTERMCTVVLVAAAVFFFSFGSWFVLIYITYFCLFALFLWLSKKRIVCGLTLIFPNFEWLLAFAHTFTHANHRNENYFIPFRNDNMQTV